MMRGIPKISVVCLGLVLAGCSRLNPFTDHTVLARVGEKELLVMDLGPAFASDLTPQDSIKLLESYVDMWVKKQLKVQEAERLFSASSADIEQMVEDYRNSLLSHKLDQYYVDNLLDTAFTAKEITDYYNEHKADFVLDRMIVKGSIVELPAVYRQRQKLKDLMGGSGEKEQDFVDMCQKNDFQLSEFTEWTDYGDFISHLPVEKMRDRKDPIPVGQVQEISYGDQVYLVYVSECRKAGDTIPMERVKEVVKRVIFNQRRQEIVRNYEDSIYRSALENHVAEININ